MNSLKHRGFTLIELVVVITIIGILAAFAIPRFVALDREAREAALAGLAGSLRSSAALAHSMWLAEGNNPASITMEGQTITIVNGYPNRATMNLTITDLTGFTYAAGTGVFTKSGANNPANCTVTYTPPAAANQPAVVTVNPNAGNVTTGC